MHYGKQSQGMLRRSSPDRRPGGRPGHAGDLTDYGLPEEARVLAQELTAGVEYPDRGRAREPRLRVGPVRGGRAHPHRCRRHRARWGSRRDPGGGIRRRERVRRGIRSRRRSARGASGAIKVFVQEAMNEALKLESALARLRTTQRIAIVHYAPIEGTVEGEPVEIYPWLGISRLEEPLVRYQVRGVVHGHAHRGARRAGRRRHSRLQRGPWAAAAKLPRAAAAQAVRVPAHLAVVVCFEPRTPFDMRMHAISLYVTAAHGSIAAHRACLLCQHYGSAGGDGLSVAR